MSAVPFSQVDTPLANMPRHLQLLLEETLFMPPGAVELQRTPTHDYLYRMFSATPNVAELFHENTKLTPYSLANTVLDQDLVEATRRWFFSTAYQPRDGDIDGEMARELHIQLPLDELDGGVGGLLRTLTANERATRLLYAIDLWVLIRDELFRVVPESDRLWMERRLRQRELRTLRGSILGLPPERVREASALLFVAAAPWRYMLFQGVRGYRRTLVDVGRLLSLCEEETRTSGPAITTTLDFYDTRVDRLLFLDGVERSVVAVVTVGS